MNPGVLAGVGHATIGTEGLSTGTPNRTNSVVTQCSAGAVVDEFPGGVVVEIVGPAGETLDLLELASGHLRTANEAHAVGPGSSS
jgi:hypothetical protein